MRIALVAMGQLEKDFGGKHYVFDFPEGSTLADLFRKIGDNFANRLGQALWNRTECRFRGPVVMMTGGVALRDPATVLYEGQEILIFKVLVGG